METTDPAVDEAIDGELSPPEDRVRIDPGDDGVEMQEDAEPEPPVTELTAEERAQFRTLLTVGQRTRSFDLFEHKITIASMTCDDELRVGLAAKPYRDTDAWSRAYQSAVVAAVVRTVDGRPLTTELRDDVDPSVRFQERLDVVLRYNPLVVQYIYAEYLKLEAEFADLARKLGKL